MGVRFGSHRWPGHRVPGRRGRGHQDVSHDDVGGNRSGGSAVYRGWAAGVGRILSGYRGLTRDAYGLDLRQYVGWCYEHEVRLFAVRRV